MANINEIADQIVGAYSGDENDLANFCVELLAAAGLHEESDEVWQILLNNQDRTVTRESHVMVDATLESINSDPTVAARLVQELVDDAGATNEQQTEVWYVLQQRDAAEQETPLLRPADVLTIAGSRGKRTAKTDRYTSYDQVWADIGNDMARIANQAVAALNEHVDAGAPFTVGDPQESVREDEGYEFVVELTGYDEEGWIDVSILLANATEYKGHEEGEEGWGVNVGADIVGYDGNILGGMTPYNYTADVWTDDPEELRERIAMLDPSELASFIVSQAIPDHQEYLEGK